MLESLLRGRSPERASAWNSTGGLIFSIAFEESFQPGVTGWEKDHVLDMTMLGRISDSANARDCDHFKPDWQAQTLSYETSELWVEELASHDQRRDHLVRYCLVHPLPMGQG